MVFGVYLVYSIKYRLKSHLAKWPVYQQSYTIEFSPCSDLTLLINAVMLHLSKRYDRHAKRRMNEREVTENEIEAVIAAPEYIEPSVKGRTNAFHFMSGRYPRVTFREETSCTNS